MTEPRFQRRKEDRPAEITAAALAAFAENGYAATRVDDVAKRAGVSKGLLYLYFKTKEELFKAVIRSFISPRIDALISNVEETELSAEEFLRGPFLEFACSIPKSPARVLLKLMVAEGPKHPDLIAWYWEHVVSRGITALRMLIQRGVKNGEFRESALDEFPQLLVTPIFFSLLWKLLFQPHSELDTDQFIGAHVDMVLTTIKAETA
ncbi:MAG: TetR/AcrR family transcriptional regulator [Gammaproteobacteria bacterium]|nr:MAG: TetR/AcrR family transcriptional regulator [Gammaproteobacteria bacterium]